MKRWHYNRLLGLHDLMSNFETHKGDLIDPFGEKVTKLNMGSWITHIPDCGTAACALGAAACHPKFIEAGLHLTKVRRITSFLLVPKFGEYRMYDAGAEFFGITPMESEVLFDQYAYPTRFNITPAKVAERVKELLNKYKDMVEA